MTELLWASGRAISIAYQLTHRSKHAAVHRPAFRWANGRQRGHVDRVPHACFGQGPVDDLRLQLPLGYGVQLLSGDSLALHDTHIERLAELHRHLTALTSSVWPTSRRLNHIIRNCALKNQQREERWIGGVLAIVAVVIGCASASRTPSRRSHHTQPDGCFIQVWMRLVSRESRTTSTARAFNQHARRSPW